MNTIQLKQLAGEPLTDTERNQVFTLAFTCPLVAGHAVYRARSVLSKTGSYAFDDTANCEPAKEEGDGKGDGGEGDSRGKSLGNDTEITNDLWRIYPNPAQHRLWVSSDQMEVLQSVQLFSGLGHSVLSQPYQGEDRMEIQLPTGLSAGLYACSCRAAKFTHKRFYFNLKNVASYVSCVAGLSLTMYHFFTRFASFTGVYFLLFSSLLAQYPDNHWVLGQSTLFEPNNGFGLVELDFTNNQLTLGEELDIAVPIRLGRNISLISTPSGDSILFYYNGLVVNNGAHELAVNGGNMYSGGVSTGYDITQGALILPIPEAHNEYALLSTYVTYDPIALNFYGPALTMSLISMVSDAEVIIKNETVAEGQFSNGQLTATRHANGRDWWILWHYENSNRYLRFLLAPIGLQRLEDQVIGQAIVSGAGAARFSPDGRFYHTTGHEPI